MNVFWILMLTTLVSLASGQNAWGYTTTPTVKGPEAWKDINPSCAGRRQSPIDIAKDITEYMSGLRPLNISKTGNHDALVKLSLEPTTLRMEFSEQWKITFGGIGCLRPEQIHWHWGSDSTKGSEHLRNGRSYPLEGHLVCSNCLIYNNFDAAFSGASGLYVIGFWYEIGLNNVALDPILQNIAALKANNSKNITEVTPTSFLPTDLTNYFRYEGSLTTPPCTENVIWTFMNQTLTVSQSQLDLLRSLNFQGSLNGSMVNTFRPINQVSNSADYIKRVIYSSFNTGPYLQVSFILIYASVMFAFIWMRRDE